MICAEWDTESFDPPGPTDLKPDDAVICFLTLTELLVQVEFEPPAAEAEDFGGLGEQASEVQHVLADRVDQQEGAHLPWLAL